MNATAASAAPGLALDGAAGHGPVYLDPRRAPIGVVELEISVPASANPVGGGAAAAHGDVLTLVRLHGQPLGLVTARFDEPVGADDPARLLEGLLAAAQSELGDAIAEHLAQDGLGDLEQTRSQFPPRCLRSRICTLGHAPAISVVVATRERPEMLARCLDSLSRLVYPRFEVIVVDNDPETGETKRLVQERHGQAVGYVVERRRGLAAAHNRGLAAARGRIVAFTDDDVIVDRDWLAAIAEGFAAHTKVGCVTGLIVPAELETAAQVMLEAHGGFAKGFVQRHHCRRRSNDDPLYPFTAGRFGSGANMAFSTAMLRELGGFDPATGAGSAARGGDDLLAFFRTAAAGYGIVYQPTAIVWHHHRRTAQALAGQAYGYGVGLGAYLAAALVNEPQMIPDFLRRIPRGVGHALGRARAVEQGAPALPRRLAAARLRGLIYGPLAYARSRRQSRKRV